MVVDGWTIIQRRVDDSVSFDRDWEEYVAGFGDAAEGNYWAGLKTIHELTWATSTSMQVYVETFEEEHSYTWSYNMVEALDANQNYRLDLSGFTADPNHRYDNFEHNSVVFSTKDKDNVGGDCASRHGYGGWWYPSSCGGFINLNGIYTGANTPSGNSIYMLYTNPDTNAGDVDVSLPIRKTEMRLKHNTIIIDNDVHVPVFQTYL